MIEEKPLPWQELLETLYRRRRFILGSSLVGLLLAVALVRMTPPLYRAEATILLTDQPVSGPREEAMPEKQIQAELEFLKSPTLIWSVLESHGALAGDGALAQPQTSTGPLAAIISSAAQFF